MVANDGAISSMTDRSCRIVPHKDSSGFGLLERKEPPISHLEILAALSCECVIRSQHYD
jgi:hypothetical protein